MKSEFQTKIFKLLIKECGFENFRVLDKKDILSAFEKSGLEESELESTLVSLERQGLIKIKYEDDNVVCLSVIGDQDEKKESQALFPFLCFLGGFIGAMLGSLLCSLF